MVPMSAHKKLATYPPYRRPSFGESGILNERVLLLVFESLKWDLRTLCETASVNRRLRATAKRLLWRELCVNRAPRMLSTLMHGEVSARFDDFWRSLAKLMFFCCGCESSRNFKVNRVSGHFVETSRFSKTSGQRFLVKKCRGDLLYMTDPCEHSMADHEDDVGVYRGVFKGFMRSRTRACLVRREAKLEENQFCPYCGTRVWSMTRARLVPKSAARWLGSRDGRLEYFVCVNGHLHGTCWLTPLSSDGDHSDCGSGDCSMDGDDDGYDNQTAVSGSVKKRWSKWDFDQQLGCPFRLSGDGY